MQGGFRIFSRAASGAGVYTFGRVHKRLMGFIKPYAGRKAALTRMARDRFCRAPVGVLILLVRWGS